MIEREFIVHTADGEMPTYLARPETGMRPLVIMYMDAYGIRQELRDMALRLATSGYCVALPNLYYRLAPQELGSIPEPDEFDRLELLTKCIQSLTIPGVMADTGALIAAIEGGGEANTDRIGTMGYCMSGCFAVAAASRFSERVRATASIYGTWLVSDDPESPHLAAGKAKGRVYFLCAEQDHWSPLETVEQLREQLADAQNVEIEVFEGTHHAFAFPHRRQYDREAAARHWERLCDLFRVYLADEAPCAASKTGEAGHRGNGGEAGRSENR